MAEEIHISSLIVHSRIEQVEAVSRQMLDLDGVEIHAGQDIGKLILTLETVSESDIVRRLEAIHAIDGVLSAVLVFHHFEPLDPSVQS
jgi:nitrate reductase NapD